MFGRKSRQTKGQRMNLTLTLSLIPVGEQWVAATRIGGVTFRSPLAATAHGAVQVLFMEMSMAGSGQQARDAETALALILSGTVADDGSVNLPELTESTVSTGKTRKGEDDGGAG